MTRSIVECVLTGFYALLDLISTNHVKCYPTINLNLNLDYSVAVTSPDCTLIALDLPSGGTLRCYDIFLLQMVR